MRLPLTGGMYQARSVIASAQRQVNLYAEKNEETAPFPFTYYLTPGLTPLIMGPGLPSRCSYTASNGNFYEVIGSTVYSTSSSWQRTSLGTIGTATTPVSMADNGLVILIVDGSPNGYCIDMTSNAFAAVTGQAGAFYGADRVDYMGTFFVLNRPGTAQWYLSLSLVNQANLTGTVSPDATAAAFDPLDIASKAGYPDFLQGIIVMHSEAWLIGTKTTEVWYNAGNPDFAFGQLPGVFIEHGTVAKYSLAKQDLSVFWLSQDQQGQSIVVMGNQYAAKRISTHAIEQQIQSYSTVSDAIGFTYQQLGHVFYVLTFPSGDATWVYDVSEGIWHERVWIDTDGTEHRHRANNCANAYGVNVVGDWQTGSLYQLDLGNLTDFGGSILRRRGFPTLRQDGSRVEYTRLLLYYDVGEIANSPSASNDIALLDQSGNPLLDNTGNVLDDDSSPAVITVLPGPQISLRYSDNGGKTWGNPLTKGIGATGDFNTSVVFSRLGVGRNRVFEVFWDCQAMTALNGGDVFFEKAET